jgi:hypothetical protein
MPDQIESAKQMISRCRRLRDEGRSEAVLRSELASRLRQVFPNQEDHLWIDHYTEGEEAATRVGRSGGGTSQGFIDTLVRSTVVEYEPDLRLDARRDQGYQQVKEYAAGALRAGMAVSQIRGVLSDTVDWHVYDIQLAEGVTPADCTDEDVTLLEVESFQAETADDDTARRFLTFLKKHLAREQSRPVAADFIAGDLGLESAAYARHVDSLVQLVEDGRSSDNSIALATDLWSRFVDYLEHDEGEFRASAYVDEAYVAILARLLCANILQQRACLSTDVELGEILNGQYFETEFQLRNVVEQDYFGWMLRSEHLPRLMPVAREMQRDLYAYDFSAIREEDLFGRLMAQLARRTQRKLLGQEWTPQWIARALADKAVSLVGDEPPCFVDMCCGSGSIMAEVIKASKAARPSAGMEELATAVTGFDIDPLAVMLAKTTWVVTLAAEIRTSTVPVTVPVYHADSLFAVTPITERMPLPGETADIPVDLDGERITLPAVLVTPAFRSMFDDIVDWCYDEARKAQEDGDATPITSERADQLVAALVERGHFELSDEDKGKIAASVHELASRMGQLAVDNRNGIWAFILRNTYRPGLLAGQFNGLVSNPPWLAMSQFADNPYKETLSSRASSYGVKPGGAAHLHAELATTHLLHAVDRYLKDGSSVACLVPGTVLNGMNHQKLRDAAYLDADRPVPFELQEVWGVTPGTFKVRSVAMIGVKRASTERVARSAPAGAVATAAAVQATPLTVRNLGRRSAWVLGGSASAVTSGTEDVPPQGADLMPRPAVCVKIEDRRGREWRIRTPRRRDAEFFAVKEAKKLQNQSFAGRIAPCFVHRMVQSLNLLPFALDGNYAHIGIPARRDDDGQWEIMDAAAIRTAGFNQTARRFQRIDRAMADADVVKPLHEKIDERRKLSMQIFPPSQYLVLNGAGGGVACAAMLSLAELPDIVVDQTLYWTLVANADEAWYRVGLINTDALTQAIREFNPEGELGPRHLHTLPNRVIPPFDPSNLDHAEVGSLAEQLAALAGPLITADQNVADPSKPIAARRRRLRNELKQLAEFIALEDVASAVLTTSGE